MLAFTKGKKTAAARILGINRRTLYRRKKARNGADDHDDMDMHDDVPEQMGAMEAALTNVSNASVQ